MNNFLLEGCVDSLASARIAIRAGVDRLERCANLSIGGTTPSHALFRQVKAAWSGPVNVLIRPRFGDFLYSPGELEEMAEEIAQFRAQGADGIVVGVLTPQGDLDLAAMEALMAAAGGLPVTLHRAFDMTADPFAALEDAVKLVHDNLLTAYRDGSNLEARQNMQRAAFFAAYALMPFDQVVRQFCALPPLPLRAAGKVLSAEAKERLKKVLKRR